MASENRNCPFFQGDESAELPYHLHSCRFFGLSPAFMAIIGADQHFKMLNPTWEKMLGYSQEEFFSKQVDEFLHPDDWEFSKQELAGMFDGQKNQVHDFVNRLIAKDGRVFWILWNANYNPADQTVYISGTNVTEMKEARFHQEKLKEENLKNLKLIEALFEAIPSPIFYKDRQGRYMGCNRGFCDFIGVTLEEMKGKTVFELWKTEEAQVFHQKDLDLMEKQNIQIYETRLTSKTKGERDVVFYKATFPDAEGNVGGLVGIIQDVTDLKQAEQSAQVNFEKFRMLFNGLTDAVYLHPMNPDKTPGRFIEVNEAACRMLGYSREEFYNLSPLDIDDPEHRAQIPPDTMNHFEKEKSILFEMTHVAKDGTKIPVELHAHWYEINGQPHAITVARDIRERKRIMESFEQNQRLMAETNRLAKIGGWELDWEEQRVVWTEEIFHICELEPQEGSQPLKDAVSYYPPQAMAVLQPALEKAVHEKSRFDIEVPFITAHGNHLWVRVMGKGIEKNGKPFLYGVFQDVTERKAAEESLHRFRAALDGSADNIFLIDRDTMQFIDMNESACRDMGYTREELLQMGPHDIKPDFNRGQLEVMFDQMFQKGGEDFFQTIHQRKDGSTFPVEIFLRPMQTGNARIIIASVRDVTERKKAKEAAEAANRAKSEFLTVMSHELRTPLNGVVGYASLLADSPINEEQRDYVNSISESSQVLATIIKDILDFYKIEAGKLELEPEPFNLPELIKGTVHFLEPSAKEKNLEFKCFLSADLPVNVIGDAGRLRQILLNLLNNSLKFTDRGKITLRAETQSVLESSVTVRFDIEDTGIGIAPETQKLLFQPFTQADSSLSRKYGGTGLGLSICKQLVEMMRGDINLESEPGHGSTFWFTVQLQIKNTKESPPLAEPAISQTTPPPSFEGLKVLVVDDNISNQKLAEASLKKLQCQVTCAGDGAEAVRAFQEHHHNVIFMDCAMPEMDGFQATREIRQLESQLPDHRTVIIAMTAHVSGAAREHCLKVGMNDYLKKPLQAYQFTEALTNWVK